MTLELYHYGVKGQKWGIRRENPTYQKKSHGRNVLLET